MYNQQLKANATTGTSMGILSKVSCCRQTFLVPRPQYFSIGQSFRVTWSGAKKCSSGRVRLEYRLGYVTEYQSDREGLGESRTRTRGRLMKVKTKPSS